MPCSRVCVCARASVCARDCVREPACACAYDVRTCVCVCVCACVRACVRSACVRARVCVFLCLCLRLYVCMGLCLCATDCVCVCVCVCVGVGVGVGVCVYVSVRGSESGATGLLSGRSSDAARRVQVARTRGPTRRHPSHDYSDCGRWIPSSKFKFNRDGHGCQWPGNLAARA